VSLILDALKKSEAERQRGQVPNVLSSLPTTHQATPINKHSLLPWLIIAALLIAALVYFFVNHAAPPSNVSETNVEATKTLERKPEDTTRLGTIPAPATVEAPKLLAEENTEAKPEASIEEPAKAVQENETAAASVTRPVSELRQQLPALKLSMHVFSADAGKRFAIIDGQRVNEGSSLGSAVVEHIRQDGVVLSVQGQTYLLPRP
jgi:general secretion pathway protein B